MSSNFLATFETLLGKHCPAPKSTFDKQECIAIQHLLYIIFVLLESIADEEIPKFLSEEDNKWYIKHDDQQIAITADRDFILYLGDLFGIKNIGFPSTLTHEDYANIIGPLLSNEEVPLSEMEVHIEQWLSDNLDAEWNIYAELAEAGELSVESQANLQRIQRRISALGSKTFRRTDSASDNADAESKKGIRIQKYTRKAAVNRKPKA